MPMLTDDDLRTALSYDSETGEFVWIAPTGRRVRKGAAAGSKTNYGYLSIRVNGRAYLAHRLAWLYVHGCWPTGEIDHLNGDRLDNRMCNLRDVSGVVNRQNRRTPRPDNASGILGVRWAERYGKLEAWITVQRKRRYLGRFDEKDAAHEAYLLAKRALHEGCTL